LRGGAPDIADGTTATREHLKSREYHHIFPYSLLVQQGGLSDADAYRALNCLLITWHTNRNIAAKDPLTYLRERVAGAALGEREIRERLEKHTVPWAPLQVGGYSEVASDDERRSIIRRQYEAFLDARADAIKSSIDALAAGEEWSGLTTDGH
jgi:hypothetical protein